MVEFFLSILLASADGYRDKSQLSVNEQAHEQSAEQGSLFADRLLLKYPHAPQALATLSALGFPLSSIAALAGCCELSMKKYRSCSSAGWFVPLCGCMATWYYSCMLRARKKENKQKNLHLMDTIAW